jgi:O-antigen/teichoic acid export membrane protein
MDRARRKCLSALPSPNARSLSAMVVALAVANGLALLVIGLSYWFYSRYLTPEEFGLYTAALTAGSLAIFLLDCGIKTTIVKSKEEIPREQQTTLLLFMYVVAVVVLLCCLVLFRPIALYFPALKRDFSFFIVFAGIHLATYPLTAVSTATLERKLQYTRLAWIESLGLMLERMGPLPLLLWTNAGVYSFAWGLLAGRVLRLVAVVGFSRLQLGAPARRHLPATFSLLRQGLWLQVAGGASLARDSLHVLLVGPFFGSQWIGYYAWCLQLAMVCSQAFVQISARISLPVMAQANAWADRWRSCREQIRLLTLSTAPILGGVLLLMPAVDSCFLRGKWEVALQLLPLVFLRMIPSLATTPLGTLLLVERGARVFAQANLVWALMEVLGAALFLFWLGPSGLAWSYAIVVWAGLFVFLHNLRASGQPSLVGETLRILMQRPGLWLAGLPAAAVALFPAMAAHARFSPICDGLMPRASLALAVSTVALLWEPGWRLLTKRVRAPSTS